MSEVRAGSSEVRVTATDELRRLLDERGVEWMPIAWNPKKETFYHTSDGVGFCADEYTDGVKIYTDATITPEQAIDATLGRGTCHAIEVPMGMHDDATATVCSACRVAIDELSEMNYCPNCGRRVVE